MSKLLLAFTLVLSFSSFAQEYSCKDTLIGDEEAFVCFPKEKKCKYFNYFDMAPNLYYDCWSPKSEDPRALTREGCSNGDKNWPECADGFIVD